MKKLGYKTLLYLLKSLVYSKRLVFWFLQIFTDSFSFLGKIFRDNIGFRFYKIKYHLQKYTGRLRIPWDSRLIEIVGKRGTLQILMFVIIFTIMIPHSKLYSRDTTKVPGRDTLLYELVGPGNQDFDLEEITMDYTAVTPTDTQSWKRGAVIAQPAGSSGGQNIPQQQEIAAISAGGTAITKPNIITGAILPNESNPTGRTNIAYHTVKPGEVVGTIAENYSISVASILWANNLSAYSLIRPGDSLKILPVSGLVHKVKRGDTLSKIANTYDVEISKIIEFNKLKEDGSDIVTGEEILVPGGTRPKPVYTYTPTKRQYTQLSAISAPPPSASIPAGVGYLWPTSVRRITQYYNWRHTGLDIAGPIGSPLYASKAGTVSRSQCGWNGGYGCYVIIDHGGGVQTLYGHATKLYVSAGEQVSQGQTIAAMGSTGRSTGPHIHFEVRINGRRLNPLTYIK